ncbi:hypothetical protein [Streptomyces sp. MZ04]|uniref:hypothetical protein n=1 Tax=Streptomyces sp. MZ04 TaxID=2559236 RepID=UPI0014334515|nr:hypothetical protein [Streptomyces sp. MZ04]
MPDPRPMARRVDDSAGDIPSLVQLGLAEAPPQPIYERLFLEPDMPPADPAE